MVSEALVKKIREGVYEVPTSFKQGMRVPGRLYCSEEILRQMEDKVLDQLTNVCTLKGIVKYGICLPDAHVGYGVPIGSVEAFDYDDGIISPGLVGFDINCGVRLLRTNLVYEDIKTIVKALGEELFKNVPSGLGSEGHIRLTKAQLDEAIVQGSNWALDNGYAIDQDIEHTEERGQMPDVDPDTVSSKAKDRGRKELGTLGSGNHFLELGLVEKIYDPDAAKVMGIEKPGQVVVWIHTGSRGYGHQICTDYLKLFREYVNKNKIKVPDLELVYAPFWEKIAQDYFSAMKAACNYAWLNRQLITHWIRVSFEKVLGRSWDELGISLVYDVAHNIAKIEEHEVDKKIKKLIVCRKGATRAFVANMPGVPRDYANIGQPILLPGDMGTCSYVLLGTDLAKETFFSTAHGAGRTMSRSQAKKQLDVKKELEKLSKNNIIVLSNSLKGVAEELPQAYKDVSLVVESLEISGIARKIFKTRPLLVIK